MDLERTLQQYASERVPKKEFRQVWQILFAYIFLCAGLTFNLYSLFYWINFVTTIQPKTGRDFPMQIVYIANIALICCLVFGSMMYRYRRRHLTLLNHIRATVDTKVLDSYSLEEIEEALKQRLHKERIWKEKLDVGLIAAILSIEMTTLDSNNVYNYIVGFVIVPLLGFVIFGLYIDRYYEGLFSNTRLSCQIYLLRAAIHAREENKKQKEQKITADIYDKLQQLLNDK